MSADLSMMSKVVEAVHAKREIAADPPYEQQLADELKNTYGSEGLVELYGRFSSGAGFIDGLMRRVIWRALARQCGSHLRIGSDVVFRHLETFQIGDGLRIGAGAQIQGRYDGTCAIGHKVWIGPQAFLDARDLVLGDYVGWGPGAKVLGSVHTGIPQDIPMIATDLEIRPVRIGAWVDIGTNATILPGVTIGMGAIVGAGAVVVSDVQSFSIVVGVPARFLRWRKDSDPAPTSA
ncbi:acyltransferase [Rhizobium sp. ARZ01]|uniref:acyltransferase n=1 Tax=Rhizobium sp. ARZ01 TaxID=2769313 RepID=UPI0017852377|nr:acyltransferase [Rhizobium sp. ARZ01]MBD9374391.1 acyltransferase [Rhizobium sp. ARZ01]